MEQINTETKQLEGLYGDMFLQICCNDLKEQIETNHMVNALNHIPFTKKQSEPTLYFWLNEGHTGLLKIKYCPFCGTMINLK